MNPRTRPLPRALPAALAAVLVHLTGCASAPPAAPATEHALPLPARPLPSYTEAVARYNQRILPLDRLTARATIRITFKDDKGERTTEQPDGTLQIVRPSKLAIDLGKSGKKLFWFGSDDTRYWWLDLTGSDDRTASVGRHDLFDSGNGGASNGVSKRLGLPLRPLDLIAAIGITPLDPAAAGTTQWSRDGLRLGIIAPIGGPARRGVQRLWVDPATMVARSIELFDARRRLLLQADHEGEERVEITRTGVPGSVGPRPIIPARITVRHFESDSEVRISLSGARDGPISDKAFDLDELTRRLGIDRTIDLDHPSR